MAEGVGFEPTVGCPTLDFESSALNRTQPPFLYRKLPVGGAYYQLRGRYCKLQHREATAGHEAESDLKSVVTNGELLAGSRQNG